jgi:hypothetical protein
MDSARRLPEHADEIILDMYRRKLLRYLSPKYLLIMPPERQAAYVEASADVAARFISTELESTLTPWPRLTSRTARLRSPGVSVALAEARAVDAVPAERSNGHWFIGPVPADDIVIVRPKVRKVPTRGVRVTAKPDWLRVSSPRLEFHTDDRVVAADDDLRPKGRLGGQAAAFACWDDLEVPVTYDGEPVVVNRLRYSASPHGQLIVSAV